MAPRAGAVVATALLPLCANAGGAVKCNASDRAAGIAAGHDLAGRVVVLTGGDSGIGYETALALAATGATIVIASYDAEGSGQEAAANITRLTGNTQVEVEAIDLGSFASVRRCAAAVVARHAAVHALVCDAGMFKATSGPRTTADGFDKVIEVNYLGHFLLTELLLPALRAGAGRVISVSSAGALHACTTAGLPAGCETVDSVKGVVRTPPAANMTYYGVSKLMQVYHMRELAAREAAAGTGVAAYSLRPGVVWTGMTRGLLPDPAKAKYMCERYEMGYPYSPCPMPASAGADTPTWLVVAELPKEQNDGSFFMCEACELGPPAPSFMCLQCAPHGPCPPLWTAEAQSELYNLSLRWVNAPAQ